MENQLGYSRHDVIWDGANLAVTQALVKALSRFIEIGNQEENILYLAVHFCLGMRHQCLAYTLTAQFGLYADQHDIATAAESSQIVVPDKTRYTAVQLGYSYRRLACDTLFEPAYCAGQGHPVALP